VLIGIDIVSIVRIKRIIGNIDLKKNKSVLNSIFSENEIRNCPSHKNLYKYYAVRFAGKEAFLKALKTGLREDMLFSDIEFLNDENGVPYTNCFGRVKRELTKKGIKTINVSFSHSRESAVAVVILEK